MLRSGFSMRWFIVVLTLVSAAKWSQSSTFGQWEGTGLFTTTFREPLDEVPFECLTAPPFTPTYSVNRITSNVPRLSEPCQQPVCELPSSITCNTSRVTCELPVYSGDPTMAPACCPSVFSPPVCDPTGWSDCGVAAPGCPLNESQNSGKLCGLSRFTDYEFDSFEGPMLGITHPPVGLPAPWLWPATHGNVTWVKGTGDGIGFVEIERQFLIGNSMMYPWRIIPSFGTRFVSGPDHNDLPPVLAEIAVELAATWQIAPGWSIDAGIQPSLQGDFEYITRDTLRIKGHAVSALELDATTTGVLGFTVLGREDIPILPVVGWIWQPSPEVRWEVIFPRPKLSQRIYGHFAPEEWIYLRSELGGNSWSIERANGARDVATYRDIRIIAGYEALFPSGMAGYLEGGWVFNRKLLYDRDSARMTPTDTFLVSAGITY